MTGTLIGPVIGPVIGTGPGWAAGAVHVWSGGFGAMACCGP